MATEEYIHYIFAWHALSDSCEKCQRLNGREWRDQDLFGDVLWDMFYGDIWDLNTSKTLAHPNCRCQLEVRVEIDWEKLQEYLGYDETMKLLRGQLY